MTASSLLQWRQGKCEILHRVRAAAAELEFSARVMLIACFLTVITTISAAAEGPGCERPGLVIEPVMKTHTLFQYPNEALRLHQEGIGIFLVTVGVDGVPTNVEVSKTSAAERLNERAIEHIKNNWRWYPPMRDCQPSTGQKYVTFVWNQMAWSKAPEPAFHLKMPLSVYPPSALARPEGGRSTLLLIDVDVNGVVTDGHVIDSSSFKDLDDQALRVLKNSPALMRGQKAGKYVIATDWDLPPGTFPADGETVIMTGRAMPPN